MGAEKRVWRAAHAPCEDSSLKTTDAKRRRERRTKETSFLEQVSNSLGELQQMMAKLTHSVECIASGNVSGSNFSNAGVRATGGNISDAGAMDGACWMPVVGDTVYYYEIPRIQFVGVNRKPREALQRHEGAGRDAKCKLNSVTQAAGQSLVLVTRNRLGSCWIYFVSDTKSKDMMLLSRSGKKKYKMRRRGHSCARSMTTILICRSTCFAKERVLS